MRQLKLISAALLALTLPVSANPSAQFSTVPGTGFAWQLSRSGSNWLLFFPINGAQITSSSPADASLLADYVNLPAMTITELHDHGTYFTATLTPTAPFAVVSNRSGDTALTASMAPQSAVFTGTNFMAFSNVTDDLDIIDHVPAYSVVIDGIVAGEAGGLPIDVSFSGDAAGGLDLVEALRANGGHNGLTGAALTGHIFIIPVPGALLLAGLGAMTAGILRYRAML